MAETKNFEIRQTPASVPLTFDSQKCIGCNRCLEACQMDLMIPGEEKGTHPLSSTLTSAGTADAVSWNVRRTPSSCTTR